MQGKKFARNFFFSLQTNLFACCESDKRQGDLFVGKSQGKKKSFFFFC